MILISLLHLETDIELMKAGIELSFGWRRVALKEAIIAITRAVRAGFNTREKMTLALPQFSDYRLALALDALFTAGMAENHVGVLVLSPDIELVIHLSASRFNLPIDPNDFDKSMQRAVIYRLGARNPAGVEVLLKTFFVEYS